MGLRRRLDSPGQMRANRGIVSPAPLPVPGMAAANASAHGGEQRAAILASPAT